MLKNPRWLSLYPELPKLVEADVEVSAGLQKATNIYGTVFCVLFDSEHSDCFVIKNSQAYFIKIVPKNYGPCLEKTREITDWLHRHHCKVPNTIEIVYDFFEEEKIAVILPFLAGIRPTSNNSDLIILARDLAKLHLILDQFANKAYIRTMTEDRLSSLQEIREKVASGHLKVQFEPQLFKKIANNLELEFCVGSEEIPLHGDLNPGNLLINATEETIFLDFEDTLHSYLPVIFELVFILERLVLVDPQLTSKEKISLGKQFIESYRMHGGSYQFNPKYIAALASLNLRSLCTLALCELKGQKSPKDEWYKFYNLYNLATDNQDLLKEILLV